MIEKLTPKQIGKFPEYIKKWTAIGLSTEPANRKEAEVGVDMNDDPIIGQNGEVLA